MLTPNAPKPLGKSTTHAVTTARVLTSKECLDIIKEKQLKKKAEEEEKLNRKKGPEDKKKKAEEKQQEALLKAQKAAERAEKARKAEEAKKRSKVRLESDKENESPSTSCNNTSLLGKRSQTQRNNSKRLHSEDTADVNNDNQCCVFFDEYVKGETWVQCSCKRWLHEDCVLDVILQSNGQPKICPECLS